MNDELCKLREVTLKKTGNDGLMIRMKKSSLCLVSYIDLVTRLTKGFGACVYVRSIFESGNVQVRLLTSKSLIAPVKENYHTYNPNTGEFLSHKFHQRCKNCPRCKKY